MPKNGTGVPRVLATLAPPRNHQRQPVTKGRHETNNPIDFSYDVIRLRFDPYWYEKEIERLRAALESIAHTDTLPGVTLTREQMKELAKRVLED